MSLLDSGPGFAQRFGQIPIDEIPNIGFEYGLVEKCMTARKSSSEDPRKGIGLHGVIEALDSVEGFFRLRTGRLSLCRPLDIHRYVESKVPTKGAEMIQYNPYLLDLITEKIKWTQMPFVVGALVTAVLPIKR